MRSVDPDQLNGDGLIRNLEGDMTALPETTAVFGESKEISQWRPLKAAADDTAPRNPY